MKKRKPKQPYHEVSPAELWGKGKGKRRRKNFHHQKKWGGGEGLQPHVRRVRGQKLCVVSSCQHKKTCIMNRVGAKKGKLCGDKNTLSAPVSQPMPRLCYVGQATAHAGDKKKPRDGSGREGLFVMQNRKKRKGKSCQFHDGKKVVGETDTNKNPYSLRTGGGAF